MKGFKLSLFLFIICWSIVISSIDKNNIHSSLELKTIHQNFTIKKNDLNVIDYSQDLFYTEDLNKICHGQANEFVWKCPTISGSEKKVLKFRTVNNQINSSLLFWYLKSINDINIITMDPKYKRQIQFHVKIDTQTILLTALYPTYPEVSGFEILQFISNLAFQCKFVIEVFDASDISTVYFALYGKTYYEYHFKGIDLSHNFLFEKIVVKKKTFLDCLERKINSHLHVETNLIFENLPQLFYKNIQACENALLSVKSCPITFNTQRIFYEKSFLYCIDWSHFREFPGTMFPLSHSFKILTEDITRIMKTKQQSNVSFVQTKWPLDEKIIKTFDEIKTQIFDTSFLMELFSKIFELCFFELENQTWDPNPEDIFKLYLRPCVMPNINLFLKYYTEI